MRDSDGTYLNYEIILLSWQIGLKRGHAAAYECRLRMLFWQHAAHSVLDAQSFTAGECSASTAQKQMRVIIVCCMTHQIQLASLIMARKITVQITATIHLHL